MSDDIKDLLVPQSSELFIGGIGHAKAPTYHLHKRDHTEILSTTEGKVYVRGEETSDVERIGAAFCEWAREWAPEWATQATCPDTTEKP